MLAHKAEDEAVIAVESITGGDELSILLYFCISEKIYKDHIFIQVLIKWITIACPT